MHFLGKTKSCLLACAAFAALCGTADAKTLNLINGWTGGPFGTAAATGTLDGTIVHLKGAIGSGTTTVVFKLPAAFRPTTDVYIPIDLCNAKNGRLHIVPNGNTDVEWEGTDTFADAQCFTSLDGAQFAPSAALFTNLTLINGWTNAPFSTSDAATEVVSNILHFKGAIGTSGTTMLPFTLPSGSRPPHDAYVHIDLCSTTNGRLHITHAGVVDVEAEGGTISNAQCFTSLDGASFATSAKGFTPLALENGWTGAPFGTSAPAVKLLSHTVTFMGAIATTGTNPVAFALPAAMRPTVNVYVAVDMCNATKGRLFINVDGTVTVQAETDFSNAQCFTSLDGVTFQLQ